MKTLILKQKLLLVFLLVSSVAFSQNFWFYNAGAAPEGYLYMNPKWLGISDNDTNATSGIFFSRGVWSNPQRSLSFIPGNNKFYFSHDLEIKGSGGLFLKNDTNINGINRLNGYNDIQFSGNGSSTQMYLSNTGDLGVGTIAPSAKFHVSSGKVLADNGADISIVLSPYGSQNTGWVGTKSNHGLYLGTNNIGTNLYLDTDDNIFVGGKKEVSSAKLAYYDMFVNGGVLTEDVGLADVNHWPDYVFDKDYSLKSIKEVETFIQKEKHLPNIPSAAEIKQDGYTIKDMDVRFLEKIEELMLYTIQQQKEIETLKRKIKLLNAKLEK